MGLLTAAAFVAGRTAMEALTFPAVGAAIGFTPAGPLIGGVFAAT